MSATAIRFGIIMLLVVDAVVVAVLVGATASWRAGLIAGSIAIAFPLMLLPFIIWVFARSTGWGELVRLYPARPVSDSAERPRLASIAVRRAWLGLNNCVHLTVDDDHLHFAVLIPGAGPCSVPWAAVESLNEGRMRTELRLAAGPTVWVPKWAGRREVELRRVELGARDGAITGDAAA